MTGQTIPRYDPKQLDALLLKAREVLGIRDLRDRSLRAPVSARHGTTSVRNTAFSRFSGKGFLAASLTLPLKDCDVALGRCQSSAALLRIGNPG